MSVIINVKFKIQTNLLCVFRKFTDLYLNDVLSVSSTFKEQSRYKTNLMVNTVPNGEIMPQAVHK